MRGRAPPRPLADRPVGFVGTGAPLAGRPLPLRRGVRVCAVTHGRQLFLAGQSVGRGREAEPGRPQAARLLVQWSMAVASTEARVQERFVLEFMTSGGARRLGIAVRPDGKKNWIVEDKNGNSQSVSPKAVLFVYGDPGKPSAVPAAEILSGVEAETEALVAENEELLEVAWEMLTTRPADEGGNSVGVETVAELVFDDVEMKSLYAAHVMLARDRFFFKVKSIKGVPVYEAKSASLVTVARAQILAEEKREREETELRDAVIAAYNGGRRGGDTSTLRSLVGEEQFKVQVAALEAIAEDFGSNVRDVGYETNVGAGFSSLDDDHKAAAKLVLGSIGKPVLPRSAFDVLVAWGVFVPHENLGLRRTGLHKTLPFGKSSLDAADALNAADPATVVDLDAAFRRDLTHLISYAIDSVDTEEIDDSISWDADENLIWVHVADPSRFFPAGLEEPLVIEALRRASTLYLPTKRFTMFPESVACDKLSLGGEHGDGSALSFGFRLMEDGALDPDATVVTASKLAAPERWTYADVDKLLASEPEDSAHALLILTRLAKKRLGFRVQDGAVISNNPFSSVSVENAEEEDPIITVQVTPTDSDSWLLVSELMIAACGVAGDFGEKHSIPLPYRGQDGFDYPTEKALEEIPEGPARNAAIFKSATPSEVLSEPIGHASLGLDAYVQVTSPIRRSGDLIAHLQIKAVLRGESPPLDVDAMNAEISRNGDAGRTLRSVDQGTSKYWHLEYLRRKGSDASHDAIYVRPLRDGGEGGLGLVYMTESGFQLVASVPSDTLPGAKLAVRVKQVDPRGLFSRADAILAVDHEQQKQDDAAFIEDLFSNIGSDEEALADKVE